MYGSRRWMRGSYIKKFFVRFCTMGIHDSQLIRCTFILVLEVYTMGFWWFFFCHFFGRLYLVLFQRVMQAFIFCGNVDRNNKKLFFYIEISWQDIELFVKPLKNLVLKNLSWKKHSVLLLSNSEMFFTNLVNVNL